MSQDSTSYTISNEHIFLIDILKRMYNDNIHQINSMTSSINNLRSTNTQIRNILVQALLYPNTSFNRDNSRSRRNDRTTHSRTTQRQTSNQTGNLGRVILDNVPYVIDSIQQYTIPFRQENTNNTNNTNRSERTSNFSRLMQNFFEPIEIFPTHTQIEAATRNVRYSDILNPVNRSCPISLEPFNDNDIVSVIRFCSHIFKREELTTWFRTNCRCPVCRYDIRNYNANISSLNENQSSTQHDVSGNFINEFQSSETNEERRSSTLNTYLDSIFDNGTISNSLSDSIINEITNMVDTDANALLRLFNSSLRRR